MKIVFGSDLHIEFGPLPINCFDNVDGEVLVLAGDIFVLKMLEQDDQNLLDFFNLCLSKFKHIILIMGNHEHYRSTFQKTAEKIRAKLPAGITFLDDEFVEINGVRFLGTTLWTDCNKDDWFCKESVKQMTDFKVIKFRRSNDTYRKFRPEDSIIAHRKALKFLEENMTDNSVVVTHHLPTFMSIPDRFRNRTNANGGYYSDLSNLILDHNPLIWLHGHTHDDCDYMVGDTRVLCNPRGYYGEETRAHDYNFKVISI